MYNLVRQENEYYCKRKYSEKAHFYQRSIFYSKQVIQILGKFILAEKSLKVNIFML